MPTKPLYHPISRFMRSDKSLESLAIQSRQNDELLIAVRSRLPDPLCDHCLAAVLADNILTLFVDSPAWTARARFLKEPLQQDLQPLGISFAQLKIKILPPSNPKKAPRHPCPGISPENATLLSQSALGIEEPQLRQSLLRLASHIRK